MLNSRTLAERRRQLIEKLTWLETTCVAGVLTQPELSRPVFNEDLERLGDEALAALHRIEAGCYGICECCRRDIREERLQAFPDARFCIRCADRIASNNSSVCRGSI